MATKYIKSGLGQQTVDEWTVAGAVTKGDMMMVFPATDGKTAVVATSAAVDLLGFAMETKTTATTKLLIDVNPTSVYQIETTASCTQGIEYDLTDKDTVDQSATTNKVLRCVKKDPGAVTTQGQFVAVKHFYGSGVTT